MSEQTTLKKDPADLSSIRYISEKEAANICGKSLSSLRNDRYYNRGIPYYKPAGGKAVKYTVQDIVEYMEAGKVVPGH